MIARLAAWLLFLALLVSSLALLVIIHVPPAFGHDWYPVKCCSERDCQPVGHDDVELTPQGWLVKSTGEVIPFGDRREHMSPDGEFHRCSRHFAYSGNDDRTICLFVPGMGS